MTTPARCHCCGAPTLGVSCACDGAIRTALHRLYDARPRDVPYRLWLLCLEPEAFPACPLHLQEGI